jgi:hypothetical protein
MPRPVDGGRTSKREPDERDIGTTLITPALTQAGWDIHSRICAEAGITWVGALRNPFVRVPT